MYYQVRADQAARVLALPDAHRAASTAPCTVPAACAGDRQRQYHAHMHRSITQGYE